MTKSSPLIWHLLHNVKLTVKISSFFVAFSENKTWTLNSYSLQPKFICQSQLDPKYPKILVLCRKNGWIMENHGLERHNDIMCADTSTGNTTNTPQVIRPKYLPKLANYLKYFWKKLLSHVHCLFCFVASHVIQYVLFKDI